jgi:hypothetical protein
MSEARVVYLPEFVVEEHLGRRLPEAIGQEFDYNGHRYRVRQRDPLRPEAEIPCELIEQPNERKMARSKSRRR